MRTARFCGSGDGYGVLGLVPEGMVPRGSCKQFDRHLGKHYHRATSLAGGNNKIRHMTIMFIMWSCICGHRKDWIMSIHERKYFFFIQSY